MNVNGTEVTVYSGSLASSECPTHAPKRVLVLLALLVWLFVAVVHLGGIKPHSQTVLAILCHSKEII